MHQMEVALKDFPVFGAAGEDLEQYQNLQNWHDNTETGNNQKEDDPAVDQQLYSICRAVFSASLML
jgi:hypothetical protein